MVDYVSDNQTIQV